MFLTLKALEKQLKALNDKFKSLEGTLEESMQNEQHLKDAVQAAKTAAKESSNTEAANVEATKDMNEKAAKVQVPAAQSDDQLASTPLVEKGHGNAIKRPKSDEKTVPAAPPPTQYHKSVQIR